MANQSATDLHVSPDAPSHEPAEEVEEWVTSLTLPEQRQYAIRNVLLLHVRGWSSRAIEEDTGIPRETARRWINKWRAGHLVITG